MSAPPEEFIRRHIEAAYVTEGAYREQIMAAAWALTPRERRHLLFQVEQRSLLPGTTSWGVACWVNDEEMARWSG